MSEPTTQTPTGAALLASCDAYEQEARRRGVWGDGDADALIIKAIRRDVPRIEVEARAEADATMAALRDARALYRQWIERAMVDYAIHGSIAQNVLVELRRLLLADSAAAAEDEQ